MNDYYKNLPRKRMASGALFLNSKGEVLIVRPTYKDHWDMPGGVVEKDESPLDACIRECKEELGLVIKPDQARFLSVDYVSDTDDKGDRLIFIFLGGILSDKDISAFKLQEKELSEFRFVTAEVAVQLLGDRLKKRVPETMKAAQNNRTIYMENGVVV
jgi:8-oxo-dGTP diphosphatase